MATGSIFEQLIDPASRADPWSLYRELRKTPVTREADGIYVVSGERVERLAHMTNFASDEGLARFEQILAKMGVDKKLRELGVSEGDTVRIAGVEFDYS